MLAVTAGCAFDSVPVTVDPGEGGSGGGVSDGGRVSVPDVHCAGAPNAGQPGEFRHLSSRLIAALGDPKHRGLDLVTSASSPTQALEGWISYSFADKALEDEDVDVFACRDAAWQRLGTARTDEEGHFSLALAGAARLPIGMRDLFVSVVGDRTGVPFLGYVAPDGTRLIVSDIDGTLTSSENAFLETIALGVEPDARAGAANAFDAVTAKRYQLVYVTARGNQFTADTRSWLTDKQFPRGPLRLSPSFITLPGSDTIDEKTRTISALASAGFEVAAGVGNRSSDVSAYGNVGVPADRIFIELPEFADEVQPLIDAHQAIGFDSFDELLAAQLSNLP